MANSYYTYYRLSDISLEFIDMVQVMYRCEACGAVYTDKEIAAKCEEHCNTRNACNVEYLRKSIGVLSQVRTGIS